MLDVSTMVVFVVVSRHYWLAVVVVVVVSFVSWQPPNGAVVPNLVPLC